MIVLSSAMDYFTDNICVIRKKLLFYDILYSTLKCYTGFTPRVKEAMYEITKDYFSPVLKWQVSDEELF